MDITPPTYLAWLVDLINQYPVMTNVFIFSTAMLESLVLVGIPVPGAALIMSFGALIALGYLDFTTTMILCISGAIAGDGISYWIGYRYQQQLKNIWPFRHFKSQLKSGEKFFQKHGGKSVVFGRFVGPVRAVIPTIAGMMGMRPLQFTIINVLSAIAWAPAYLLPGMVFGASLELASEVALRLVVLIMAVIIFLLLLRWLLGRSLRYLQPRADYLTQKSLNWARRHRYFGPLVESLIDPRHPESPALFFFALLLILSGIGFFLIIRSVFGDSGIIDVPVYELMLSLRTPWMDGFMVAVSMLGDSIVIFAVALILLAWLLYHKNIAAALHMAAALLFGAILTRVLTMTLQVPHPDASLFPGTEHYSFPSKHSTMAMLLYGFLSVIISREIRADKRIHIYAFFGLIIMLIAISRIYLGAHWLTDVLGGLTLGLIWVTLLGITYRRHHSLALPARSFIMISLTSLILVATLHWNFNYQETYHRYAREATIAQWEMENWLGENWKILPTYRQDIANSSAYPFNLQWNESLDNIKQILKQHGWIESPTLSIPLAMRWLSKKTDIEKLPILPQVHNGEHETLTMTYSMQEDNKLWVLRLWPSRYKNDGLPVWLGQIAPMTDRSFIHLFHYPVTERQFSKPLEILFEQLKNTFVIIKENRNILIENKHWHGEVLLIHPKRE